VMGGFAYADTAKNGITAVVTATDAAAARGLARDIAERGWAMRERFKVQMTSIDDAVVRAVACGRNPALKPVILADCADNPGGGARGNTTAVLRALKDAGAQGVLLGIFNDAALAAEAHTLGVGAKFRARFNRAERDPFSEPYEADATVLRLGDGKLIGRRGILKGVATDMGPCAALDLGGITVVVITHRQQCADPMQLECLGLDIGQARSVVVKSRGHFRSGFDEFFPPEQVIEVNGPGLTSPDLKRFPWKRLPRPIYPMDEETRWTPPAA
jgi:microcystin degradation protein MlrC